MSFWQFLSDAIRRAIKSAFHKAHVVYFVGFLAIGVALIFLGWKFDKDVLIYGTTAVFLLLAFIGVSWQMYRLYREADDGRKIAVAQLETASQPRFAAETENAVRAALATLNELERGMMLLFVTLGGQTEEQLREYCKSKGRKNIIEPGQGLSRKTGLFERSGEGRWYIKPDLLEVVKRLL